MLSAPGGQYMRTSIHVVGLRVFLTRRIVRPSLELGIDGFGIFLSSTCKIIPILCALPFLYIGDFIEFLSAYLGPVYINGKIPKNVYTNFGHLKVSFIQAPSNVTTSHIFQLATRCTFYVYYFISVILS